MPTPVTSVQAQTVLVVDDESLIRWSLRDRLSRAGYRVLEAGDAAHAEAALRETDVDLVLLDFKLPDADGISVLEHRADFRGRPAVIMMTAFGTPETAESARRLGASHFIGKPFDLDEMMGLVRSTLAA